MSTLKMIFRTELLLLFRNKFLAIPLIANVLLWGYIVISYEVQTIHFEERAATFYGGFIWMILLNLLIVGLFAVYMASKDRASEFEHLVATYRVKNIEWIIGKWLVAQLYGLCIVLITLFIQIGWFLSGKMPVSELAKNTMYVFVQMEGAFFLLISLGFLFSILIKNVFAYLFIPALIVLSLGLPFDYTGVAYSFDNPKFHLLTPFDYMFIESPYEGIWGIDRVFASTLLHQMIVFLLGLFFIFVALLLFRPIRIIKKEKKFASIIITVLIIPIVALSGIRFVQYNDAFNQYTDLGKEHVETFEEEEDFFYESHLDNEPYEFSMEKADLTVDLQANHQLRVQSNLTIKNNSDAPANELYLTLYQGLNLMTCESDSAITCSRDKDYIIVQFDKMIAPGEQFELRANYEGNILQYRGEGFVEHSFIQNNRVYLPKGAGWYPLIGQRKLVVARGHGNHFVGFELRNASLVEDYPTEYSVEVLNKANELPLALTIPEMKTGVYEGVSQYGLSLVGGNLEVQKVDQTRVVSHPEVFAAAKKTIAKHQETWRFIEGWLEVPMTPDVIYILDEEQSYLERYTPTQEVLIWDSYYLKYTDDLTAAYEAVRYLLNETSWNWRTDLHLLEEALRWSLLRELQDVESFKKWYSPMVTPMEETDILNQLDDYEKQDKLDEVVKFLYQDYIQLEAKDEFNIEKALRLYEGEPSK